MYAVSNILTEACKDCCDLPKEIHIGSVQNDDIGFARKDPNRSASFEYEQLLGDEAGNKFLLFHEGEMETTEAFLTYIRKPKEIHAATLVTCDDGTKGYEYYSGVKIDYDAPFEGDSTYASRLIVDIAVLCASRDKGQVQDFKTMLEKILRLEKPI